MKIKKVLSIILLLSILSTLSAQTNKVRIYGYIINEKNRGIESAKVEIEKSKLSTITNKNGFYEIFVPVTDSITISYSHIGYKTLKYTIKPNKQVVQITTVLPYANQMLDEVKISTRRRSSSQMETLNASKYKLMPNATGSFESLLIGFAGVTSNNELSSQYNVRGGNFDENIVYVNGTEIYRPILIRAGQQEGLSFINPDMVGNVKFSSGGFNAEYGDKMSSVLDVTYKKPTQFEASAKVSLLGASAYVGTSSKKFKQLHGIRYKTSEYLLGTLDTKGSYKPNFIDYQTYLTYDISPKWELNFLGNFSQNSYVFLPDSQSTSFGTYNMAEKLTIFFEGKEKDLFQTAFGTLNLKFKPNSNLQLGLSASAFNTNENETFDIMGQYVLSEMKMDNGEAKKGKQLGVGTYLEHARNRLKAKVFGLAHKGIYVRNKHTLRWGLNLQKEMISDKINEWELRDSAGYTLPRTPSQSVNLFYNMTAKTNLNSLRTSGYLQDTYRWDTDNSLYALTGGLRASYWTFNKELIVSPRVSLTILPHWEHDFTFRLATGIYYQSPFYKEIRKKITDGNNNNLIYLNDKIKSQRSYHFVLGGDYFFRVLGRPFKFTTEAYLKLANQIISYSVDNVRIRYSGENDAKAYTAGIDFKLFGELVPGTDSWINFSLMRSKEDLLNDFYVTKAGKTVYPGQISRPNEQRYSFSMLFTDYLPNNPKYKLYLKGVYSDGLPIGPPRSPRYLGDRFRLRSYKRVDIGVSRVLRSEQKGLMSKSFFKHIKNIWLNLEAFNLFDFKNENSIYWVSDVNGIQHGSPNYLTGRQLNLKIIVDFK